MFVYYFSFITTYKSYLLKIYKYNFRIVHLKRTKNHKLITIIKTSSLLKRTNKTITKTNKGK